MSAVKFRQTSFGPGALVRFKDVPSHRWTYGIYRGVRKVDGHPVAYEFSETPLGPATRWLAYWPKFIECAVTVAGYSADDRGDAS